VQQDPKAFYLVGSLLFHCRRFSRLQKTVKKSSYLSKFKILMENGWQWEG
jgi:hypothetical protein